MANAVVRKNKIFKPHTYFKTRKGLRVSNEFNRRVLARQPVSILYRGCEGMTSFVLPRLMSDHEIINEFLGGIDEVFTHGITLDQIAEKIDLQPNGKDGELLNNGQTNIFFYVSVIPKVYFESHFAVSVKWDSGRHEWWVCDWPLNWFGGWGSGSRGFRNTTLKA